MVYPFGRMNYDGSATWRLIIEKVCTFPRLFFFFFPILERCIVCVEYTYYLLIGACVGDSDDDDDDDGHEGVFN